MPLVSGIVVFVFGGLTLYLQDDIFIKMKPTIVNTLFGVVLLGGLCFGKSLLGYVFDSRLQARRRRLAQADACAGACSSCSSPCSTKSSGGTFSTDSWVAFKVWGIMPITLLFTFSQMPLIMRHSLDEQMRK